MTGTSQRLLSGSGQSRNSTLEASATALTVDAGGIHARIPIPTSGELVGERPSWSWKDEPLDLWNAFPRRPATGDQREKLLWTVVQDASNRQTKRQSDATLRQGLRELVHGTDPLARRVVADVLADQYWVQPTTARTSFAFPFHSVIPANYDHPGRYKMYRGSILLLLCWNGALNDIDPEPVRSLLSFLSSDEGITALDEELLEAARELSAADEVGSAAAEILLGGTHAGEVRSRLAHGAFDQTSLDIFRGDLLAALALEAPRQDKISNVIVTLSFHLAIYYYRVAFLLGSGLDRVIRAAAGQAAGADESFNRRILFRVGTAGDRPIRETDPAATSWNDLDDRHLIALSGSIITANLLHHAWKQTDPSAPATANPAALADAMEADRGLADWIDAAAGGLAILYGQHSAEFPANQLETLARLKPGPHALRQAVLERRRQGGRTRTTNLLKYHSRDVVNQLMRRPFGGSLLRTRGRVRFFEVDEDLLFLLVHFAVSRARTDRIPFAAFLDSLGAYGMAPQDPSEEQELAHALERLGMLKSYSDAGEAKYVRSIL